MRRRMVVFLGHVPPAPSTLAAIALTSSLALGFPPAQRPGPTPTGDASIEVDKQRLERIENLSESLANDLLKLSVATRDRNGDEIARHFSPRLVATPLPTVPAPLESRATWITEHGWRRTGTGEVTRGGDLVEMSREVLLARLGELLDHFSSVEDARFKVKEANFELPVESGTHHSDGANVAAGQGGGSDHATVVGTAHIKMFVIGRDAEGRREWLTSWMQVEAEGTLRAPSADTTARGSTVGGVAGSGTSAALTPGGAEDPVQQWQIRRLHLESLESMVAERDLFVEVAQPAHVDEHFPDFGTPPNDAVIAHGGAAGDVNHDGLLDLVVTGVSGAHLYLNDGEGGFVDASEQSLLSLVPRATGALLLDGDNDGDLDLFLAAVGQQKYLENRLVPDGLVQYFDVSIEAGVALDAVGFSAAATDVNGDGLPDVYVASYNRYGVVMPDSWHGASNGTPNLLFINQGGGRFREAGLQWGVRDGRWSYAATFADVDRDGDQDLYVANDFGSNALYLNERTHFREAASDHGVVDPGNGMGAAFGDYDNDGDLDLHVTNMSSTAGNRILARLIPEADRESSVLKKLAAGNSLFENLGDGHYRDVTQEVGGLSGGWAWGGGFIDLDNNGWEDLYTPNGFVSGKSMNDT